MEALVIDLQLFPCLTYFKKIARSKHVILEVCDWFKKMGFRNRYIISGANGLINLTIPIVGGREQRTLMRDVLIGDEDHWQRKHWRAIVSSYNKAPYFDHYAHEVEMLICSQERNLVAYNMQALQWCLKQLGLTIEISLTHEYTTVYEKAADFRDVILPKNYQHTEGVVLPVYAQVFQDRFGFLPNLSILDLIFSEGPNAGSLLKMD